jgi:hypothetical protein
MRLDQLRHHRVELLRLVPLLPQELPHQQLPVHRLHSKYLAKYLATPQLALP